MILRLLRYDYATDLPTRSAQWALPVCEAASHWEHTPATPVPASSLLILGEVATADAPDRDLRAIYAVRTCREHEKAMLSQFHVVFQLHPSGDPSQLPPMR